MEQSSIYKKLAAAKNDIKASKMKKEGRNNYSNYDYFLPEQVEHLVFNACINNGLLTTFDLIRNEFGETGRLTVIDIDTGQKIAFDMATAIPEIKATNIAQQLGGCVTYTERYLKMSAFGITENALDFDDKDNTKKEIKKPEMPADRADDGKPWLNPGTDKWKEAIKWLVDGGKIETIEKNYKISKANRELLISQSI